MTYLYFLLDVASLSIPLLFSFHPKLKFYRYWPALFLAIALMMLVFVPWDIIFTKNGIWGFNDAYYFGTTLGGLPLEEWLFFVCIPYACVFTHISLVYLFPKMVLSQRLTALSTYLFIAILVVVCILHYDRWYTFVNSVYAILLLCIIMYADFDILKRYYLTFLVILIPFFMVNGILTGNFIENEVVWYNHTENLRLRIMTIPIEDVVYAFSMILTVLALTNFFHVRFSKGR